MTFLRLVLLVGSVLLATSVEARPLVWARSGDALTLDPHAVNEAVTHGLNQQIYEPLVRRGHDGSLVPVLALSWRMIGDANVWEFDLRPNVVFHDGSSLTADDVVFSLQRAMMPTSGMKAILAGVASVQSVDIDTVQITTTTPSPLLPENLTYIFIMSRAWAEANDAVAPQDFANGAAAFAADHANGTGPYVLVSRSPGVETRLVRFEDYWGRDAFPAGDLGVTEVTFEVITSVATRVAALLAGDVDFVQDMPVQDIPRILATDGLHVETGAENRTIFFGFNVSPDPGALKYTEAGGRNPFAEVLVRQAIGMAIDREAIRDVVMNGQSVPAGAVIPPGVNGYDAERDRAPPVDLAMARAMMAAAGYVGGFSTTLHCTNDRYINDEGICQAIVGMLAQIGIEVRLELRSKTVHFPELQRGELDFYLLGWGVPNYDSDNIFNALYHTKDNMLGGWNGTHFSDPAVDAAIAALAAEVRPAARNQQISDLWNVLQPLTLYVPLHHQLLAWGISDNLTVSVHPDNVLWLKDFAFTE